MGMLANAHAVAEILSWDGLPEVEPEFSHIPVFVLHGLGERTDTLQGFVAYLKHCGWKNVYTPRWPANTCHLEDCLNALDLAMQQNASKTEPILVIGNSMGGIMAYHLHMRNWTIAASYSVASPLKGSYFYRNLKLILPSVIWEFFHQSGHDYLNRKDMPLPPPHPWFTVGFDLVDGFDGQVHLLDMLDSTDTLNHTTLVGHHFSLALEPRIWRHFALTLAKQVKV